MNGRKGCSSGHSALKQTLVCSPRARRRWGLHLRPSRRLRGGARSGEDFRCPGALGGRGALRSTGEALDRRAQEAERRQQPRRLPRRGGHARLPRQGRVTRRSRRSASSSGARRRSLYRTRCARCRPAGAPQMRHGAGAVRPHVCGGAHRPCGRRPSRLSPRREQTASRQIRKGEPVQATEKRGASSAGQAATSVCVCKATTLVRPSSVCTAFVPAAVCQSGAHRQSLFTRCENLRQHFALCMAAQRLGLAILRT